MQYFGVDLKLDPHFFLLIGIIQSILVAFSIKTSMACIGMLSYENDSFNYKKKLRKPQTARESRVSYSSNARGTGFCLQTSPSLTRNMNVKVVAELYYIFSKISKFGYW